MSRINRLTQTWHRGQSSLGQLMFSCFRVRPCIQYIILCVSLVVTLPAALRDQLTATEAKQLQREARLVFDLLQNYHYSGRPFRELKNQELLASFLGELDPQCNFLLQADGDYVVRRFGQTLKPVYLARGDLQPAFEIFELLQKRVSERVAWIEERLKRDFDFEAEGEFDPATPSAPAADTQAADARWELLLKDAVLSEIIAGRNPTEARAEVARRYREFERTLRSIDPLLVRERFFDSVIRGYDPHSGYFSADSAQEFAVTMGQSLAGTGLRLAKRDGRCVIDAVDAGGPADLHSNLEPGDCLLAAAEGDAPWRDLAPLRLREIVGLLRGAAGTSVRLAYAPAGTKERKELALTRAEVISPQDRASGGVCVIRPMHGKARRVGWVQLPSFYSTPAKQGPASSVSQDVREIFTALNISQLDALVVDLRHNPGGTLDEAVALCGLFLPPNSVVLHTRLPDGKSTELKTSAEVEPLFRGPLVVLTSEQSASASEVFAGAMQFHRRALIVGSAATYGKGTVQNYIELATASRLAKSETANWGTLRLTAQRFYLPNGGAVQRAGIAADIALPGFGGKSPPRESALPGALSQDTLPGVSPAPASTTLGDYAWATDEIRVQLRQLAERDLAELDEWKLWRDEAAWREARENARRPLSLSRRQAQHDTERARREALRRTRRTLAASVSFSSEAINLAALTANANASSEALRALDPSTLPAAVIVETESHQLRKLRASQVDFNLFSGDTAALATAFSRATGQSISQNVIADALRDYSLRTERTPAAWLDCFRSRLDRTEWSDEKIRRGLAALLHALPEIEPEMSRDRTALDIPLRQALRVSSAWAELHSVTNSQTP